MNCDRVKESILLSAPLSASAQEHLLTCSPCRQFSLQAQAADAALRIHFSPPELPSGFDQALRSRLAAAERRQSERITRGELIASDARRWANRVRKPWPSMLIDGLEYVGFAVLAGVAGLAISGLLRQSQPSSFHPLQWDAPTGAIALLCFALCVGSGIWSTIRFRHEASTPL